MGKVLSGIEFVAAHVVLGAVWFGVMTLIMPHLLALTILFYLVSALVVFVSFVLYIIASSLTTAKREKPEFVIPTYRPR